MKALTLAVAVLVLAPLLSTAKVKEDTGDDYAPHTPTLTFHVQGLTLETVAPICTSEEKLKSVTKVIVDPALGTVQVRFDSHVVSYHQVAYAIMEVSPKGGKPFDPTLKFVVPDYAKATNAQKVDEVFSGKRLNSRVKVVPLDKANGVFLIHFLPLKVDPSDPTPQGFNGGHLHHPISDPTPRGLGLPSSYPVESQPSTAASIQPQH